MADNQENYIVTLITETKDSLKNLSEWRREVDAAKKKMQELQRESGASLSDVRRSFLEAAEGSMVLSDDIKRLEKVTSQAMKEMKTETQGMGDVVKIAFGVSLGQIAVRAIQSFIREIKEGIKRSIEFSGEVARLNVNLRAFQRTGGDLSASELTAFIDEIREKFRVFSERELVSGTQAFLNYARQLDLTGDQTKQFLDLAAQQSIVMGQDLPTSVRQLATAITTGRTQSLRPLGIALSGTRIESMALAEGLIEAGDVMTNQARAAIILSEGMRTAGDRAGDLDQVIESLEGQQQTLSSAWQDTTRILGDGFAPALRWVNKLLIRALDGAKNWINLSRVLSVALQSVLITAVQNTSTAFKNLWKSIRGEETQDLTGFREVFRQRFKDLEKDLFPLTQLEDTLDRVNDGMVDSAEQSAEELKDIYGKLAIDIRETLIDMEQDIDEANEDFRQKRIANLQKFWEKKEVQQIKFQGDIAKINRRFQDKLAELEDDFREDERQKEKDHLEALRKLREDFLLDLEGALQERNAKQILSLIKQFNLRQAQLKRQQDLEKSQRRNAFDDRIEDLRRERDIRIREAQIEYKERMRLMKREFEFQREMNRISHQQKLDDIREETKIRIEELVRRFEDEQSITEEGAQLIAETLKAYFGEGGQVDKIYDYLMSRTEGALKKVSRTVREFSGKLTAEFMKFQEDFNANVVTLGPIQKVFARTGTGLAEGGTVIANEPTTVTFGEDGPEKATFEPIGRVGQNENQIFSTGGVESSEGSGKMAIELFLDPSLEARIIDESLSQTAEVLIKERRM